jgi:hypothetical protein
MLMLSVMRSVAVFLLITSSCVPVRSNPLSLLEYFQKRTVGGHQSSGPSYEAVLVMIDGISVASPDDIRAALPVITSALSSNATNVVVEAAFALSEIARRPDGGVLLGSRVKEIAGLLRHKDERLSGGGVLALGYLTKDIPGDTVPLLLEYLTNAGAPSILKTEITRVLLHSGLQSAAILQAVEKYFALEAPASVKAANLNVLATSPIRSVGLSSTALRMLEDRDPNVKLAAMRAVYYWGPELRAKALSSVNRFAADPGEDSDVREVADRFIRGILSDDPPQPSILRRPIGPSPKASP